MCRDTSQLQIRLDYTGALIKNKLELRTRSDSNRRGAPTTIYYSAGLSQQHASPRYLFYRKSETMTKRSVRSTFPQVQYQRPLLMPALLCMLFAQAVSAQGLTAPGALRSSPSLSASPLTAPAPVTGAAAALTLAPAAPTLMPPATGPASKGSAAASPRPAVGTRAKPAVVDSIVAVVNNEVITHQDLEGRIKLVEQRMKSQGVSMPPVDQFRKQLLERMIVDKAQLQLAKETGITVDDLFLDKAVARIAEQNKLSVQELRNQLEKDGTPFAVFREGIREEVIMQRLREREVDNKIQISESEIDAVLASSAASGTTKQSEVNIAQVLVRIPENASPEQIAQRRQRADEALQQLRSGAEFAKVAAAYSDAVEGLRGGELGWRAEERLPQLFVEAISDRKPGDITVVKSANGFHILKFLGRRDAPATNSSSAFPAVQQTHVRHILIKVNQVMTAAEARRKLLDLKERLQNKSAKFEDLAKVYSNDLSASKGGDLGWIYPGDTVPEFERVMNALKPGEISDPVESQFGLHLIEVVERKTDDVSRDRQRMAARQVVRERKLEEATEDWLRQLRDRAYVEYRAGDVGAG
jgi:peptidyl-prolyl cis-trans isomerase SurA